MFRAHRSARAFLVIVEFVVDCLVNEIQEDGEADFVVPLQLFQLGDLACGSSDGLARLGIKAKNLGSGILASMAATSLGLLR